MRFIAIKTMIQQGMLCVHRLREDLKEERTACMMFVGGFLRRARRTVIAWMLLRWTRSGFTDGHRPAIARHDDQEGRVHRNDGASLWHGVFRAGCGLCHFPLILFGSFMDWGSYGFILLGAAAVLLLSVVTALRPDPVTKLYALKVGRWRDSGVVGRDILLRDHDEEICCYSSVYMCLYNRHCVCAN
jgi:hypothetical protein